MHLMDAKSARTEDFVARLAARQHGVVSRAQLEAAGVKRGSIQKRVAAGRLHRVHQGVYAVGHPGLSDHGRWSAAALACGEGAVLSHSSAAALWGLLSLPGVDVVHVTVPGDSGRRKRRGIRLHRSTTLGPDDVTRRRNIPVTTPTRTLIDLRRTAPRKQFAAALRQAEALGLPVGELDHDRTRSELEARFLAICRRHRIPAPEVNVCIGPYVVDFLWPQRRLIVELDGYRFHRGREAFESDRARDLELTRLRYEVVRLTWRQLESDPAGLAATVRGLLAA
jgi:very-short-patch-repair endonuclease